MKNPSSKSVVGMVMFAVAMLLCLTIPQNAMAAERVVKASGLGGASNWTIDCFDSQLNRITADLQISLYDDDWDEIFEDVEINAFGGFIIQALVVSTEYNLVIESSDLPPEYKMQKVHVTTPASGNTSLPTTFIFEEYFSLDTQPAWYSTTQGLFSLGLALCAGVLIVVAILASPSGRKLFKVKKSRRKW